MFIYKKKLGYCLAILILSMANASIADSSDLISFAEVKDSALKNSPLAVEVLQLEIKGQALASEIGRLNNPELQAEVRPSVGSPEADETEYEVGISQKLRLSDFGTRQNIADLINSVSSLEQRLALHELVQDLKLTYTQAWLAQEREVFAKNLLSKAEKIYHHIKDSEQQGLLPTSTTKFFAASIAKFKAQNHAIASAKKRAFANLMQKANLNVFEKKLQPLELSELPNSLAVSEELNLPTTERLKLQSKIAQQRERLARLDAYTTFSPKVAFEQTDEGLDRINVGLSFDLPFFDQNQNERLNGKAERNIAEARDAYRSEEVFRQEVDLLLQAFKENERQEQILKMQVLPAMQEALQAAEREFASGKGDTTQVLQILLELFATHEQVLELKSNIIAQHVEILVLLGKEI